MTKLTKTILIATIAVLLVGVCLTVVALANGGNFNRETQREKIEHRVQESFSSIDISMVETDIEVRESADGSCYLVCYESDKTTYTLTVENGTLKVVENDMRKWYDHIGIYTGKPRSALYIPSGDYTRLTYEGASAELNFNTEASTYGEVSISTSSGDIGFSAKSTGAISISSSSGDVELRDISADAVKISTSSGDIDSWKVSASSMKIDASSGEIELEHTDVTGKIEIESSSGDITLSRCDGGELDISTSSGEVEMSLLSDKEFDVTTGSGSKRFPSSVKGAGKCRVKTSSGDVSITVM